MGDQPFRPSQVFAILGAAHSACQSFRNGQNGRAVGTVWTPGPADNGKSAAPPLYTVLWCDDEIREPRPMGCASSLDGRDLLVIHR